MLQSLKQFCDIIKTNETKIIDSEKFGDSIYKT